MNDKNKLRAGGEVDSYCTRCRLDLNHRIVAMVGEAVKRVECLTCGSQHNYRKPKSERDVKAPATRKATGVVAPSPARNARKSWEQAIAGQPANAFAAYRIDQQFSPGQLLRHSKFGDGVVVSVLERTKIEVLFEDGPRTLAHGLA